MQNAMEKEQQDNLNDDLPTWGTWLIIICFVIPWVLGIGVVGMFLIDVLGVNRW